MDKWENWLNASRWKRSLLKQGFQIEYEKPENMGRPLIFGIFLQTA
jgi:hypothetical protein